MTSIDPREAAAALSDIDAIVHRVRQSRIYNLAAFVAIGLFISALALIGYFFAGDWFLPWMAVVNGGGLILGGLWMRRS